MDITPPTDLAPVHTFLRTLRRHLPRALAARGGHARACDELLDDMAQEVMLDWLEHAPTLRRLGREALHQRWLRLVDRCRYRLQVRARRLHEPDVHLERLPSPEGGTAPELPADDARFLAQVVEHGVRLKNGRLNTLRTAASIGLPPRELSARETALAEHLGVGERYVAFWRRRLVEALLGLAADVLRDRARVVVHGEESRVRPDPHARLRRVRHIRRRLAHLPQPADLRRALARYARAGEAELDPSLALQCARQLAPDDPDVGLWRFELALSEGALGDAAAALRGARRCGADAVAVLLARARLLEARGRYPACKSLLCRGVHRHGRDPRLLASLDRWRTAAAPLSVTA